MRHPWIVTVEVQLELVPVTQAAYEAFRELEQRQPGVQLPRWQQLPMYTRQAWEDAIMTAFRKLTSNAVEVRA